jgi:choice-of-anchor A domain-containing protein
VINATGNAANFSYYGLTNNTTLSYSGSSPFIGTVYAPEASFTFSGAGGMYGAAVVDSYTLSGSTSFHYDQALSGSSGHTAHFSYTEL